MPARLTVHVPFQPTRTLALHEPADYLIGRDLGSALLLDDERVSRRHARLTSREGAWYVEDLDSKNGTSFDGKDVSSQMQLDRDGWLSFGGVVARFETLSERDARVKAEDRFERWHTSLSLQQSLSPALGLEELLRRVLQSVLTLSGAERGFVMLRQPDGELEVLAAEGMGFADLRSEQFSGSISAIQRVLDLGSSVAISDAQLETHFGEQPSVIAEGIRGLVCVPLRALDRILGVIYADSSRPGAVFDELDVDILEALTGHAALALAVTRIDHDLRGLVAELPVREDVAPEAGAALGREIQGVIDRTLAPYGAPATVRGARRTTWTGLVKHHRGGVGAPE